VGARPVSQEGIKTPAKWLLQVLEMGVSYQDEVGRLGLASTSFSVGDFTAPGRRRFLISAPLLLLLLLVGVQPLEEGALVAILLHRSFPGLEILLPRLYNTRRR